MKRLALVLILSFVFSTVTTYSQVTASSTVYIDVVIDRDKKITIQGLKSDLKDVSSTIAKLVREIPFKPENTIVYRIVGDSQLKYGDVLDVQQEMLAGYSSPEIFIKKYLLNTNQMPADRDDLIEKLRLLDLQN